MEEPKPSRGRCAPDACSNLLTEVAGKGVLLSSGAVQGPGCSFQEGCRGCPCSDVVSLAVPLPAQSLPCWHPPNTALGLQAWSDCYDGNQHWGEGKRGEAKECLL